MCASVEDSFLGSDRPSGNYPPSATEGGGRECLIIRSFVGAFKSQGLTVPNAFIPFLWR